MKTQMTRHFLWILAACLLVLLTQSCAVNPVTGKRELMLYSEQDEIAMGEQTHAQISQQYGIYNDPEVNKYVTRVGSSMTQFTHRPHLEYHFAVLDSPVVNAFAVPGGYIYVTRGILSLMNSEAELAVVLGHELGHVNARHSMKRLSNTMMAQIGLVAGSVVSKTFADIANLAGAGLQLLFLQYSRDDEREADSLGVSYSRSGQYNPSKMIDFFGALEKMGDLSGGQSLPGFLSTHPLTSERIENTRAMIQETDSGLMVRGQDYLGRIQNMVYGSDPRQGFVEGNAFYHPELRFRFSFPEEWKVQNLPSQVMIIAPDEKAGVILQAEKSSVNPKNYADEKAKKLEGATLRSDQSGNVNGLSAHQQVWDVPQEEGGSIRLRFNYIQYASYIYTFTALCSTPDYDNYSLAFGSTASSFRTLTDRKYLNRKPTRIKLTSADGNSTLQQIFHKQGLKQDLWKQFAIMNAMELDQKPQRGQPIKTIK
jgi:predicted Zn-dependent protease